MKPTGFADLKTKTRQSLKVLDPQNAGSRLHPKLWDRSSANSHKAQLWLDKHLKKKFPLSERTLKFYKLLGLHVFETWSPLLTKKLELKKDFPLLTFSEMERLLGRTLNWEQPSRKLIQKKFRISGKRDKFYRFWLERKEVFETILNKCWSWKGFSTSYLHWDEKVVAVYLKQSIGDNLIFCFTSKFKTLLKYAQNQRAKTIFVFFTKTYLLKHGNFL